MERLRLHCPFFPGLLKRPRQQRLCSLRSLQPDLVIPFVPHGLTHERALEAHFVGKRRR